MGVSLAAGLLARSKRTKVTPARGDIPLTAGTMYMRLRLDTGYFGHLRDCSAVHGCLCYEMGHIWVRMSRVAQ